MPELRKDPVLGRWVIISTERARRPVDFKSAPPQKKATSCPFCEGNEAVTPPEIFAFRSPESKRNEKGWRVRVVPNKFPALMIEGDLGKKGEGIYDIMNGVGAHEVIIEGPGHELTMTALPDERISEVLMTYRERMLDLRKDARLVCGLIFKNVGEVAGASLEHTHSQLIVTPIAPLVITEEMAGGKAFFNYRGRCLFCDMITQEIGTGTRIVLNSQNFVAFEPFAARFPFETWILPKRHVTHFENTSPALLQELAKLLKQTLLKIEGALGNPPYNYLIHSTPFDQGEVEYYHWHIEIIPRITRVAGFEWGSGFYINPVPPENAAEYLRQVNV
jgi:UDPglucose--hexose-1-phosphate uridylyltransferase